MTPPDRLKVICTDRGTHPPRDLGLIMWSPDGGGGQVWDARDDQTYYKPEAVAEITRKARSGTNRVTKRSGVETRTRNDGGVTFVLPRCPTCGTPRQPRRELRDDRLGRYLRGLAAARRLDGETPELDVSLIS